MKEKPVSVEEILSILSRQLQLHLTSGKKFAIMIEGKHSKINELTLVTERILSCKKKRIRMYESLV